MNRERAKELLPIIEAYASGATVQFRVCGESDWSDGTVNVGFHQTNYEYRIKPEPAATNDIKWASHRRQCGRAVRRKDWQVGAHWREGGVYTEDGVYAGSLTEDDCLAEDWELFVPEAK